MAGLRHGRPSCIRAAFSAIRTRTRFQKRQAGALHGFQVYHKKNHMDFVEGIWREFLDPYGDWEDTPGRSAHSVTNSSLGHVTGNLPLHMPRSRSPVHSFDPLSRARALVRKAAGRAPSSLEATDVDMQPVDMQPAGAGSPKAGAGSPKARASAARLSGSPEGLRMMEEDRGAPLPAMEPPETGRRTQGRARASRPPPRLGSERDKGPKLSLSKRKLELLLAEPEKNKRKRQRAA
ncbi:PREDICTED: uncharacterized protein LOC109381037 isoform X2 [Hipposideros armiger]|uniref:Uncharacterized protein LOC109381037 isoform X2 n=1 Tax=Hipposideros armiger TaxID=186990 RepID=A0A8B7R4R9_HIPAR|nr:PREDICTED: uncharacterized protein LOC109381037 isoform X2 [Hipposideros armiger]